MKEELKKRVADNNAKIAATLLGRYITAVHFDNSNDYTNYKSVTLELDDATRVTFDLIFEHGEGDFGIDIYVKRVEGNGTSFYI